MRTPFKPDFLCPQQATSRAWDDFSSLALCADVRNVTSEATVSCTVSGVNMTCAYIYGLDNQTYSLSTNFNLKSHSTTSPILISLSATSVTPDAMNTLPPLAITVGTTSLGSASSPIIYHEDGYYSVPIPMTASTDTLDPIFSIVRLIRRDNVVQIDEHQAILLKAAYFTSLETGARRHSRTSPSGAVRSTWEA